MKIRLTVLPVIVSLFIVVVAEMRGVDHLAFAVAYGFLGFCCGLSFAILASED